MARMITIGLSAVGQNRPSATDLGPSAAPPSTGDTVALHEAIDQDVWCRTLDPGDPSLITSPDLAPEKRLPRLIV